MLFPCRLIRLHCLVHRATAIARRRFHPVLLLLPALLLAACGREGALPYGEIGPAPSAEVPERYYPPPGPAWDPWGPYIREAAARYQVPEQWIRAVMQQESGGEEQAVSPVGAMGLMQVMPETYEALRERYGLGADPYNPHSNILAGTAYIREMYDRYGSPGFLAAYNAGPDRVDAYLAGEARLPSETVNYIAAITPNLGEAVRPSGPLTAYAAARFTGAGRRRASVASLAAGCDLDAAYDPNHPCTSLEQAAVAPTPPQQVAGGQIGTNGCNLDAAYDPSHPCAPVRQVAAAALPPPVTPQGMDGCNLDAAYDPDHPCTASQPAVIAFAPPPRPAARSTAPRRVELAFNEDCDPNAAFDPQRPCLAPAGGAASPSGPEEPAEAGAFLVRNHPPARHVPPSPRDWAIQVGAFASPGLARAVAEGARRQAPSQLRYASLALPTTPFRRTVLYRARLVHLSEREAAEACTHLNRRQLPCVVVRPSRS
jgi:D-alanyl-D-alanine carboxypeptidase